MKKQQKKNKHEEEEKYGCARYSRSLLWLFLSALPLNVNNIFHNNKTLYIHHHPLLLLLLLLPHMCACVYYLLIANIYKWNKMFFCFFFFFFQFQLLLCFLFDIFIAQTHCTVHEFIIAHNSHKYVVVDT